MNCKVDGGIGDQHIDVALDDGCRGEGERERSAPERPQFRRCRLGLLKRERVDVAHAVIYAERRIGTKRISTR